MGRKDEGKTANGNGRIKFRVIELEIGGGNEAVTEGLKALNAVLTRTPAVATPSVRASLPAAPQATKTAVEEIEEQQELFDRPEEQEAPEDAIGETSGTNDAGHPRKKRIPPSPKIVDDLDVTAGDVTLKSFVEKKAPKKAQERIVIVSVWLKKHRKFDEINRDHLYTCFQQMGGSGDWKCPNDFEKLLRQLGKRKGWFEKGSSDGSFKVTIIATNYVDAFVPTT